MSRLCRFFVIIIVAYTAAGCTPVGSIGGGGAVDFLLVEPTPPSGYKVDEIFRPSVNLKVSVPSASGLREIPKTAVTISVSEPPNKTNGLKPISLDAAIPLKQGRYVFVVEYLAMTASCYVDVSSPEGTGTAGFIEIIWVD